VAFYGLTHIAFDDRGAVTRARLRAIDPTLPVWLGHPVDMELKGLAAVIRAPNKVIAVFDAAAEQPRDLGGEVRVSIDITGRPIVKLLGGSPGRLLQDLPRL